MNISAGFIKSFQFVYIQRHQVCLSSVGDNGPGPRPDALSEDIAMAGK